MDDMNDDKVLAQDKKMHPECSYASSVSTACRNVNGERMCETIRKIYRMCPGKKKELVINSKKTQEGNNATEEEEHDPFQFFVERRRKEAFGEMMDPFEAMDGILRGMMPSFGSPFEPNRQQEQVPHRGYRGRNEREEKQSKEDAFKGYDGRVEEI
ncbi:hypothetical protein THRCLA_22274 [Thraustotheca clavata]|uniref:Uncharacterized protein n=1 Tax=Thraustotheca clavata TaxID=74557 RepID=A0A1V9Z7P6_9STRA|nr:hypothetical protein THRCLA_22274 [Thraustotheca clavata]